MFRNYKLVEKLVYNRYLSNFSGVVHHSRFCVIGGGTGGINTVA